MRTSGNGYRVTCWFIMVTLHRPQMGALDRGPTSCRLRKRATWLRNCGSPLAPPPQIRLGWSSTTASGGDVPCPSAACHGKPIIIITRQSRTWIGLWGAVMAGIIRPWMNVWRYPPHRRRLCRRLHLPSLRHYHTHTMHRACLMIMALHRIPLL